LKNQVELLGDVQAVSLSRFLGGSQLEGMALGVLKRQTLSGDVVKFLLSHESHPAVETPDEHGAAHHCQRLLGHRWPPQGNSHLDLAAILLLNFVDFQIAIRGALECLPFSLQNLICTDERLLGRLHLSKKNPLNLSQLFDSPVGRTKPN